MARNIEIKASVASVSLLVERASMHATSGPTKISQDDTFFRCNTGRLKLRAFPDGSGELIFYKRENADGPKTSFYEVVPTAVADSLRSVLNQAYGQVGRVRKERTVYMVGRTRVHIDQVEGLGSFMELEVVLAENESEDKGKQEAYELMAKLGIKEDTLIDQAYVDLLNGEVINTSLDAAVSRQPA
jgi:predicted adenylyl cyclase CyaB